MPTKASKETKTPKEAKDPSKNNLNTLSGFLTFRV